MECKNCNDSLRTDYSFCPACGAKVIRNRLTVKNLWYDFTERFFNLDNTFIITFKHLFTKPEAVIGGYINGVRKRYMNPISYLTVALVFSGLAFLVLRKFYGINLMATESISSGLASKIEKIYDYQTLLAYISLPIYAIITWLIFIDKNRFNISEHFIINFYIVAQYSILQFFILIPIFGLFKISYADFSNVFMFFVIGYQFYVLKKLHKTKLLNTILRAIGYTILMIIGISIVYGILFIVLMYFNGDLNLQDFKPQKP